MGTQFFSENKIYNPKNKKEKILDNYGKKINDANKKNNRTKSFY